MTRCVRSSFFLIEIVGVSPTTSEDNNTPNRQDLHEKDLTLKIETLCQI